MIDPDEVLIRIVAPHFVAGIVAKDGRVIAAADILRYMEREKWDGRRVAAYCKAKGWTWERVGRRGEDHTA